MKNIRSSIIFLVLIALISSGCLTYEKKEYHFKLSGENSGTLTIKYINIMSIMDDTLNVSEDDFDELVSEYLNGNIIENSFPGALNIKKKLFEENGVLCGEISMDFNNLEDVKIYRYLGKGPYMFNTSNFDDYEAFESSNGEFGGEIMPVIFWHENFTLFDFITTNTKPDQSCVSMMNHYKSWSEAAK